MRKQYSLWLIKFAISLAVFTVMLAGFNLIVDPLWTFSHRNFLNSRQDGFNERQQKTNIVTFRDFDYKGIILGSSRTTYISQKFFPIKTFNYSVSNMKPAEFIDYLDYAKKRNGKPFEYIILSLDFFGTNGKEKDEFEQPEKYIERANTLLYRYKMLFSMDTLVHSYDNVVKSLTNDSGYNRDNIRIASDEQQHNSTDAAKMYVIKRQLEFHRKNRYGNYEYQTITPILQKIKNANPDAKFIVFTTPISHLLWKVLVEKGHVPHYLDWLSEIVEVFGEVYDFMGENSITKNLDNYYDSNHFSTDVARTMMHKVFEIDDQTIPDDFGVRIDKDNISEFRKKVKDRYQE